MKHLRKILLVLTVLALLAFTGVFIWLRSTTLVFESKILADCSLLGKTAIPIATKTRSQSLDA
jgi:hypothetical protein